jgi:hypothetical protein
MGEVKLTPSYFTLADGVVYKMGHIHIDRLADSGQSPDDCRRLALCGPTLAPRGVLRRFEVYPHCCSDAIAAGQG